MVFICTHFFTLSEYVLENSEPLQYFYLYYKSNYCSMDCHQCWTFNKLWGIVKSGAFSASLELLSSILDSVYIWQDKSTDNSAVYSKNYILWNMKNDLPPACIFQISLMINSESTWPGLIGILERTKLVEIYTLGHIPSV